jgi:hypothetical protein
LPTPPEPFALTGGEVSKAKSRRRKGPAKHTAEEIAAKDRVVSAFSDVFETKKQVKPRSIDAGDHVAAFKLAKVYGAEEGCAIIRRAFEDPFVVGKNATIRFIASKADTWRGVMPAKANGTHPAITRAEEDVARSPNRVRPKADPIPVRGGHHG